MSDSQGSEPAGAPDSGVTAADGSSSSSSGGGGGGRLTRRRVVIALVAIIVLGLFITARVFTVTQTAPDNEIEAAHHSKDSLTRLPDSAPSDDVIELRAKVIKVCAAVLVCGPLLLHA